MEHLQGQMGSLGLEPHRDYIYQNGTFHVVPDTHTLRVMATNDREAIITALRETNAGGQSHQTSEAVDLEDFNEANFKDGDMLLHSHQRAISFYDKNKNNFFTVNQDGRKSTSPDEVGDGDAVTNNGRLIAQHVGGKWKVPRNTHG
ncbi:uncharacterized protein LOC117177562 [Belonocnema kinseyi]|uniref:uncharacterized protein LOC117177562 n=1 Tax=Belonocnema kinseyi TaxID=2817044 RepID=UPI00143CC2B6|nr:uncharacterized protein LOC117177562 [Belonocnema kinseyi]